MHSKANVVVQSRILFWQEDSFSGSQLTLCLHTEYVKENY